MRQIQCLRDASVRRRLAGGFCRRLNSREIGRSWPAVIVLILLAAPLPAAAHADGPPVRIDEAEAVRRALAASHLSAAARHRVGRAEEDASAADAERMPRVGLGVAAGYRSSVPEFAAPVLGPGEPPVVLFPDIRVTGALTVEISQPLYTGGAVTARREAARNELVGARSGLETSLGDVRLAARTAYWHAAAALAGAAVAESQVLRVQRLAEDARALRNAGVAVDADVLGAEARLAAARVVQVRAEQGVQDALAALRSLLDLPAGTALVVADGEIAGTPPSVEPLDDLQAEAGSRRPELGALRARSAALASRSRASRAASRPAVSARAAWDTARPNSRHLPLTESWNDSWSVAITGSWTVWDGGRSAAATAAVEAERRAAAEELGEAERQVILEVERAWLALGSELAAAGAADASRAAAAERLRAVEDRYTAGLAVISEVLDAQSDLAAAEGDRIVAGAGARLAAARLARAVGR